MRRRSPLLPVLFAVVVASCDASGPREDGLPALREGFTYLKHIGGFIRDPSLQGFTIRARGLARWNDRVGVVVMTGQFFRTFATSPVYDWSDGSSTRTPGGGDSEVRWYSLHLSDDGGATWREVPLQPFPGEPTGPMTGLILTDDRVFTTVHGGSGRQVVEVDPETGFYEVVEVHYADGDRWQPTFAHARVFGPVVVSSELALDARRFTAWRGNLATGAAHRFAIQSPECVPWHDFLGTSHGQGHVATSPEAIEGLCTMPDDRVCSFRWSLREDAPETTPMEIRGCSSRESFVHPPGLASDGAVPEFAPVDLLFGPGGMWVVGEATSGTRGDGTLRIHGAALALRPDGGPPDVVDLGPSGLAETDRLFMHPHRGGLALVPGPCGDGTTEATGACAEDGSPTGDHDAPRLVGWDEDADAFGMVRLSPSACADPGACPMLPAALLRLGDGRYLSAWTMSTGFDGDVMLGLAVGVMHAPWYAPPPPPPEPGVATPLEMRCWAEIECDPTSRWQDPFLIVERVRSCIDRWRQVQGAPDTLWEAFVGTALDDCEGLRAADPAGFVSRDTCPYGECDPSGQVVCASQRSCEHANGGACTVVGGVAGCFADACSEGAATPAHCDAAGRWVDCVTGMVDDCAARGLTCVDGSGCLVPDPRCEAHAQRCDGNVYTHCLGDGAGRRIDCARAGQACESGDWGAACAMPYVPPDPPRCEENRLFVEGRIIDCAAVGMRCQAQPDLGIGFCEPS